MKRERNGTWKVTFKQAMCSAFPSVALCVVAVLMLPQILGTMPYVEAVQESTVSGNSTSTNKPANKKDNDDKDSENDIKYVERSSDRVITDDDRADADADLLYYMQSLEVRYHLDEKVMERLDKLLDSAVYYVANTEMSLTERWCYVSSVKGNM